MNYHDRNFGCRIIEFSLYGYRAITLENEKIRVSLLVDMGTTIYEFLYKETDTDFMHRDPNGLGILNGYKPTVNLPEGNYLNYTVGGWYELFPNAGNFCTHRGAPFGVHGEVQLLKWDYYISKNTVDEIEVTLNVKTVYTPFTLEKKLSIKRFLPVLFMEEKVTNTGLCDVQYMWGHHITLGEAFLNEHCRITLPDCKVFKRPEYDSSGSRLTPDSEGVFTSMPGRSGDKIDLSSVPAYGSGISEMLFIRDLEDYWYSVFDAQNQVGIAVCWDRNAFPGLWFWQEFNDFMDFPWYGKTYAMALEPASSNTPMLADAVKDNSCSVLRPGECKTAWITAVAHRQSEKISGVSRNGYIECHK